LEKKKSKGILKLGQNRCGGVVVSQKQGTSLSPFLILSQIYMFTTDFQHFLSVKVAYLYVCMSLRMSICK